MLFQVIIDNTSDEAATIVKVMFGDRLGLLLDTVEAMGDQDLDIVRALCETEDDKASNVFYVTGLEGGKVTDPQRIEVTWKSTESASIETLFDSTAAYRMSKALSDTI